MSGDATTAVVTNAAGKIAPSIFSFFLGRIYEAFFGNSYSTLSRKDLDLLKEIFMRDLEQTDCPALWKLDTNYRPISYFHGDDFNKLYTTNNIDSSNGNYPAGTKTISQNIIAYLNERKKRWFARSTPGDLLEQFLYEWLDWSINSLPTMGYDSQAIKTLEKRLRYLDHVMLNVHLFHYGTFDRIHNKYNCFEIIKKSLTECLTLAKQERMRVNITLKLDVMRGNMARLLLQSVDILYYSRKTNVSATPLLINYGTIDSSPLTIQKSPTGQMLNELIHKTGTATFTLIETTPKQTIKDYYFDSENNAVDIEWGKTTKPATHDLPIWVASKNEAPVLSHLQRLGSAILHYAEIKQLIEKTYNVAAQAGNIWAYSDSTGKRLIKAIIYLHDKALQKLKTLIDDFMLMQNSLRSTHTNAMRKKQSNSSSDNIECLERSIEQINLLTTKLIGTINEIEQQLLEYEFNSPVEINQVKQDLYQQVNKNFQRKHPDQAKEFNLDIILTQSESLTTPFDFPLKVRHGDCIVYDDSNFQQFTFKKTTEASIWRLGESYTDWTANFFINNKLFFDNYAILAKKFQLACQTGDTIVINDIYDEMNNTIGAFAQKIDEQKPRWRLIPLTAGWPFNSNARQFATLLTAELSVKKIALQTAVNETIQNNSAQLSTTSLIANKINMSPTNFKPPSPIAISKLETAIPVNLTNTTTVQPASRPKL